MKHFWLIRHAKSSWEDSRQTDFERPLNERGRRNGADMRGWLAEHTQAPEWLLVSAAARAQETGVFVSEAFTLSNAQIVVEKNLYHAPPELLLDAVRGTPPDYRNIAVVAHNPGLTYLVNELSSPEQAISNLPTFGCALFQAQTDDWLDVAPHNSRLVDFMTPKLLPG